MPICVTDHVWVAVASHCVEHNNATHASHIFGGHKGAGGRRAGIFHDCFLSLMCLPAWVKKQLMKSLKSKIETARSGFLSAWCFFWTHPEAKRWKALFVQISESNGLGERWEKQMQFLMWNGIQILRLIVILTSVEKSSGFTLTQDTLPLFPTLSKQFSNSSWLFLIRFYNRIWIFFIIKYQS